ncbi:MAG: hypothetical protein FGM61_09005, partial [Sediminibacterium sp.]|nr:hypothetical protein [Sediminibacterium sp.]
MKKIFLMLFACCLFTVGSMAQTKKAEPAKSAKAAAGPTKAHGTPDIRFKENKGAPTTKQAGPTKKDGTPVMRFKENK